MQKIKQLKLFGEQDIDSALQQMKVGKLERHLEREIRKRKPNQDLELVAPVRLVTLAQTQSN